MLDKMIVTDRFKLLETHVQKLLAYVQSDFGSNQTTYFLYTAFLLTTDTYHDSIFQVDRRLQILLADVDKYWLKSSLYSANPREKSLKRDVVRLMILRDLITLYEKRPQLLNLNMPNLKNFLDDKLQQLKQTLEKNSEKLEEIFQQNIDFAQPREHQHYLSHSSTLVPGSFGLISASFAFFWAWKLSSDFTDNMMQEYNLTSKDMTRFNSKFLNYHKIESALLAALIMSYLSFVLMRKLSSTYHRCQRQDTNSHRLMTISEFNSHCKGNSELLPLTHSNSPVDNIWHRRSHLMTRTRTPVNLREYVLAELDWLSKEMPAKEMLMLLSCCLVEVPNMLNDVTYPTPIEILRKPQTHWTRNPDFQKLDDILQSFVRLGMIEFIINDLLGSVPESPKKDLLRQWLTENTVRLKTRIETLLLDPGKSFLAKYLPPKILLGVICALAAGIIGQSLMLEQSFKSHADDNNKVDITKAIIGLIGCFIGSPFSILAFAKAEPSLSSFVTTKLKLIQTQRDERNATTTFFFTNKIISGSPQLKAIFGNDGLDSAEGSQQLGGAKKDT